jgi:hypothetical protein
MVLIYFPFKKYDCSVDPIYNTVVLSLFGIIKFELLYRSLEVEEILWVS